jgi:hypothetical protein
MAYDAASGYSAVMQAHSRDTGTQEEQMQYQRGRIEKNEADQEKDEAKPKRKLDPKILEKETAERLAEIHQFLQDRAARLFPLHEPRFLPFLKVTL